MSISLSLSSSSGVAACASVRFDDGHSHILDLIQYNLIVCLISLMLNCHTFVTLRLYVCMLDLSYISSVFLCLTHDSS